MIEQQIDRYLDQQDALYEMMLEGERYEREVEKLDNSLNTVPKKSVCARCGRALKNPRSIKIGMGPSCAKKMAKEFEQYCNTLQMTIPMTSERLEGREKEERVMRVCGYVGKMAGLMEYLRKNANAIEALLKQYRNGIA